MTDRLVHPFRPEQLTKGMTRDAITSMMDTYGYVLELHTEGDTMPGVQPQLLQGPQASTFRATAGGSTSNSLLGGFGIPSGIAAPDFNKLIRDLISGWLGGGSSSGVPTTLQQGPLVLPPSSGTPGVFPPGGIAGLPSGGFVGGRVPFITMPNGLPGCPSGYHPEKSGQPYCVRNRRMNPLNPRALSRATRRVGGFARAVKRARTLKKVCKSL